MVPASSTVVQQLRTRSEVFHCCSTMTKINQLADWKNVTEVWSAKMCSFSVKVHCYGKSLTLLQKSWKYLHALLSQWQNSRYLFKFAALLKPSGICTSHVITGLHHWSVKWTLLTSHSVTVSSFRSLLFLSCGLLNYQISKKTSVLWGWKWLESIVLITVILSLNSLN